MTRAQPYPQFPGQRSRPFAHLGSSRAKARPDRRVRGELQFLLLAGRTLIVAKPTARAWRRQATMPSQIHFAIAKRCRALRVTAREAPVSERAASPANSGETNRWFSLRPPASARLGCTAARF